MSRPLRIAMLLGYFPVVSETFILRQIVGLIELGHTVDIYANSRPETDGPMHPEVARHRLLERTTYINAPPEATDWELPVWPLRGRTWLPGSENSIPNVFRLARAAPKFIRCLVQAPRLTFQALNPAEYGHQARSLSTLYRLGRLCAERKPFDVAHAHFGPVANSFRFARQLWRAPFCASFHGYDFSTLPRQSGAGMYQKLFADADAVTVSSEYSRRRVEGLGCPATRLHILPVGLDPSEFQFNERTRQAGHPVRILTVARLVEIKGHEYALRAIALVRRQAPEIRYDVVGDGPLRPKLEALIRELKLEPVVALHGALDGPSIRNLMGRAHLFVLASVSVEGDQEGQGLALQEAQAAGLPVIATRHGALPEGMVPDESGFLVPERDVEALAERLNFLLAHPELWPGLGRAGRSFVEARYDIRALSRQLTRIYETAIADFRL